MATCRHQPRQTRRVSQVAADRDESKEPQTCTCGEALVDAEDVGMPRGRRAVVLWAWHRVFARAAHPVVRTKRIYSATPVPTRA